MSFFSRPRLRLGRVPLQSNPLPALDSPARGHALGTVVCLEWLQRDLWHWDKGADKDVFRYAFDVWVMGLWMSLWQLRMFQISPCPANFGRLG